MHQSSLYSLLYRLARGNVLAGGKSALTSFSLPPLYTRSEGKTCAICMEIVKAKLSKSEQRFGILSRWTTGS